MKNRSFRRWLTLVLVLAMLLGILPAVAAADASLSDYAPAGTTNLAVGATLTVSNGTHNAMGQENSYEMPSEHWSKDFVHDGVLDGQGFSLFCNSFQRRDRDSNPGYLAVQRFSRPPQSTTLPPLQNFLSEVLFVESVAKVRLYFKYARLLNKKN